MSEKTNVLNVDAELASIAKRRAEGGKLRDRIAMIGIELEGGWCSLPYGIQLTHDGSVRGLSWPAHMPYASAAPTPAPTPPRAARGLQARVEAMQLEERLRQEAQAAANVRPPRLLTGELPSPPMPPSELVAWMKKFYPHTVNGTCGLHVHMSFQNALHYARLMTPSFQDTILAYITSWAKEENLAKDHPIWPRIRGESIYCQPKFWADQQALTRSKSHDQQRHGHRYTMVNYCFSTNGTVEVRLLPMMQTCDLGIRAIQRILDITNAFLARSKDKESREKSEVKGDSEYQETRTVQIRQEVHGTEIRS